MTQLLKKLNFLLIGITIVNGGNIESSGDGSFCISKPPKRSVLSNCTSNEMCERLLNVSPPTPTSSDLFSYPESAILLCGDDGECVSNLEPQNEYCKEACDSSDCSSLCLQLYETKTAKYCIETRDHPNAMPPSSNIGVNKYYCTCILSTSTEHRHRVVSRHLKY